MSFKIDLNKIALILGVWIPLWGGVVFLWNYEKSLIKSHEFNLMKIDSQIGQAEIKVIFLARDYDELTQGELDTYEELKATLINLKDQRSKLLFGDNESN